MQNKKKLGKLITFEGIDGCGKTTQISKLKKYFLNNKQKQVIFTREPGGVKQAEIIRKSILNNKGYVFRKESEVLLLLASRYEHYKNLIEPAIKRKKLIVSDRFTHSTIAYQCADNKNLEVLYKEIYKSIFYNFEPDLTILLDVSPKIAFERIARRKKKNIFDMKSRTFFEKVRKKYLSIAKNSKNIIVFDASENKDALFIKIKKQIIKKINNA